ncbi:tRNA lysidine(34) synthetase TilS [Nonomuraea terrae]|uniref:tRNA(Ile)-lysidine synthase n=1 Tax=Nonomuraea terrae TaxID=2530383 RepID=A0A4R4YRS1_9ACTN|nr:tRNA lysidine(34) synthetase TilS [Nonomuraea terrae]TDD46889.1 tRNA lysidine(34) synthetase TilS [Nonomuraea terrae]
MGPHPAVADVRRAVREALADVQRDALVLAACSGGADSLALAAALGFVAPRMSLRAGLLTVDHRLQAGSAGRAATVAEIGARDLGLDPAEVLTVTVGAAGGPEAAAREARYAALAEAADRLGAAAVLLGHTRDDQAETVLLGLARGSGPRSLSGMAAVTGRYRRPFLDLSRATTVAACAALGLDPWDDPHNDDPRYTRVRVRRRVLPVLEAELGPGVAEALARTARLAREDADALDEWAESAYQNCALSDIGEAGKPVELSVAALERLPDAVRRRVLRRAAIAAGAQSGALFATHVLSVDRLITSWHGQKAVDLPGGLTAVRRYGTLILAISPIP